MVINKSKYRVLLTTLFLPLSIQFKYIIKLSKRCFDSEWQSVDFLGSRIHTGSWLTIVLRPVPVEDLKHYHVWWFKTMRIHYLTYLGVFTWYGFHKSKLSTLVAIYVSQRTLLYFPDLTAYTHAHLFFFSCLHSQIISFSRWLFCSPLPHLEALVISKWHPWKSRIKNLCVSKSVY